MAKSNEKKLASAVSLTFSQCDVLVREIAAAREAVGAVVAENKATTKRALDLLGKAETLAEEIGALGVVTTAKAAEIDDECAALDTRQAEFDGKLAEQVKACEAWVDEHKRAELAGIADAQAEIDAKALALTVREDKLAATQAKLDAKALEFAKNGK